MTNTIKTVFLLTALAALMLFMGQTFGGRQGLIIAGGLAFAMTFFSYWFSDKIVLKMYRAQPVDRNQAPEIYDMVERIAHRAGIPAPRVYWIDSPSPNAFATGRNPANGVVAITHGLARMMDREELEGVIAHEIGHIANRDTLIMAVVATIAQAIMMLRFAGYFMGGSRDDNRPSPAVMLLMMILAPLVAMIIQMAISRTREYKADAAAARFVGHPNGLARALQKLERGGPQPDLARHPAAEHMFIANPLSGAGVMKLFSTHPSVEDRVNALLGRKG